MTRIDDFQLCDADNGREMRLGDNAIVHKGDGYYGLNDDGELKKLFVRVDAAVEPAPDPEPEPAPEPTPDPEPDPDSGEYDVATGSELAAALDAAQGGETIHLAPGHYGALDVRKKYAGSIHIIGGTFSEIRVTGARNVTFSGILVEGANYAGGEMSGDGVFIRNSEDIYIHESEVRGFNQGIRWLECKSVAVVASDIHTISGDGLKVAMVDGLNIVRNHIHDFRANPGSAKHRDMLQIFTLGHDYPSKNIIISDNLFDIGSGDWTQSIYARNEMVDQGKAGREFFYENFVIEDNVIRNAQIHGISIGEADGLVIRGNYLTYVEAPNNGTPLPNAPIPRISVAEPSVDVVIEGNTAPGYRGELQPGWTVDGNDW